MRRELKKRKVLVQIKDLHNRKKETGTQKTCRYSSKQPKMDIFKSLTISVFCYSDLFTPQYHVLFSDNLLF